MNNATVVRAHRVNTIFMRKCHFRTDTRRSPPGTLTSNPDGHRENNPKFAYDVSFTWWHGSLGVYQRNERADSEIERGETRETAVWRRRVIPQVSLDPRWRRARRHDTPAQPPWLCLLRLHLSTVTHCGEDSDWPSGRVPRRFHKCLRGRAGARTRSNVAIGHRSRGIGYSRIMSSLVSLFSRKIARRVGRPNLDLLY